MHSLLNLPPKQGLALLLAEKARREHSRLAQQQAQAAHQAAAAQVPQTATPQQYAAHSSLLTREDSPFQDLMRQYRYKIFFGGRDSAKSWSIAEALVKITASVPLRVLCTREYQNSVKDSVHALLKNTIYRLGLASWFTITNTSIRSIIGGEFIFKGLHNNVQEIKSTEGVDICWVEEAHSTTSESWQVLIPTIRKPGSQIWVSFNVTDEEAPTYQRFVVNTPPNSVKHLVNFDQNPFLSAESKQEIAWLKQHDYNAFEHVYLGIARKISDAIIFGGRYRVVGYGDEWPIDLHTKAERLFTGMDHGFANDPYAFIRSFVISNKLYIEHEAFGHRKEFAGKLDYITEAAFELDDGSRLEPGTIITKEQALLLPENIWRSRGELEQLADEIPEARRHPIKADNSRPETISFMSGKGYNISAAEKWKGSVEDGISHIKGFDDIIIHDQCKRMQIEARLYAFRKDKMTGEVLPEVLDKNNHGWDAVRYSLDGYIQKRNADSVWAKLGKGYIPVRH